MEERSCFPVLSVCIERCESEADAARIVPELLDAAGLWPGLGRHGLRVLVKPNLLRAVPLACTSPAVTAAACRWLLDVGARPVVADSPGFGSAGGVAAAVGLTAALAPLGIRVEPMRAGRGIRLATGDAIRLSATALEADAILSAARVKAHSQMLLTLSVKNLYGCVPGLGKAFHHTVQGADPDRFAAMQAAVIQALPPVAGLVDGVTAMHVTGPSGGRPYPLGLLAASASPVALDESLCRVLGREPDGVPLQRALIRAGHPHCGASGAVTVYPRLSPADFDAAGFILPERLMHTSFRPGRLLRSCARRVWDRLMH